MASNSNWVNGSNPYFIRDNGGVFSFNYNNSNAYGGRGVAVVGAGLLYRMKYIIYISNQKGRFQGIFRVFSIYKRNIVPSLNGKNKKIILCK